jgi:hypothetical protein
MSEEEPLEQNIERLIRAYGGSNPMAEQDKKDVLAALAKSNASQRVHPLFRWLAAAAAILLIATAAVITIRSRPDQPINIPPELAEMTAEQLLELHRDPSASAYKPEVIEAALRQALDRLAPADVIQLARVATAIDRAERLQIASQRAAPPVQPVMDFIGGPRRLFPEVIEDSNLFVHARVAGVTLDVEALKEALIRQEMLGRLEDFMNSYRVTVQLEVIDALPAGSLAPGSTLTVPAVLAEDQLNALKEGSEYYIAMTDRAGEPRFLLYFSGVYPVDPTDAARAELWPFFTDAQDILLFGNTPSQETIDYWVARMQGETLPLALEYMALLRDELIPVGALTDAVERRYAEEIAYIQTEVAVVSERNKLVFEKAINLLLRAGDENSIQHMLDLLDADIALADRGIIWRRVRFNDSKLLSLLVRMKIATAPGNLSDRLIETYVKYKDTPLVLQTWEQRNLQERQARFAQSLMTEIVNQAATMDDEDVTAMLREIFAHPGDFGISEIEPIARLWSILGARDSAAIRSYLEEFLADPTLEYVGVAPGPDFADTPFACEQSAFEVLQSLRGSGQLTHEELMSWLLLTYERHKDNRSCLNFTVNTLGDILQPTDTVCIPLLTELLLMDKPHWAVPQIIAQHMPNPALAEPIRKALEKGAFNGTSTASLIAALYACGQEEQAITEALERLTEPLNREDRRVLRNQLGRNASLVLFLGTSGRKELLPLIEEYTRPEYVATWNQVAIDLGDPAIRFRLDELRQNAIMALARLGGKSSIKSLRRLYDSPDIRVRIVSALALYYLGDKTGEELVSRFADGTHRLLPEVATRWHVDLAGGTAFQSIVGSYLRNERTDELWLTKLTHDIEREDTNVESAFFRNHRAEILDIAVAQLDNPSRETRGFAAELLRNATGHNFGFHPSQYPRQQEQIVQQWRDYLDTETTANR